MIPDRYLRHALFTAIAFIPFAATAQTAGRDPLNSPTTTSNAPYQSAFTEYKNFQDPEWVSWRVANDVVREFGSMAVMEGMEGDKGTASTGGVDDPKNKDEAKTEKDNGAAKPAHDMSKMTRVPKTNVIKARPSADMKSKEGMANMPGHDMGSMKGSAAPTPQAKQPAPVPKPAAPQAMPDHSGMQKQ